MSSVAPEIQHTLKRFRRSIRRYVLLEGIAGFLALSCLLFWMTFGLDLAHFQLRRLELPGWFRSSCTILMSVVIVGVTLSWIAGRMIRALRPRDLALVLERWDPKLHDRLITAVELRPDRGSPLHRAMLEVTSDEAARQLSGMEIAGAFNPEPLRRVSVVAGVLLISVLVFGVTHVSAMERWVDAYILMRNDYWEPFRQNALTLQVIAQPGDRVREFDTRQSYRHPRGADLQLVALAADETLPPDDAYLSYLAFGGAGQQRGNVTMSRVSDGEFRHSISRVVEDHHLWIQGGDYISRQPFRIQIVDPPQVDELRLQCDYPDYVGLEAQEGRELPVVGTQVSLPMETHFELIVRVNKRLVRAHLRSRMFELSFGQQWNRGRLQPAPTRLVLIDPDSNASRVIELDAPESFFFSEDRQSFRVPFHVSASAIEQLQEVEGNQFEFPLPLPPDTALQISLEDEDQIYSPEPALVSINAIVDQPPVVDARRTGIGTLITRMASLPIEGRINDDYGVTGAWFEYRVDEDADVQTAPLEKQPNGQKEFTLSRSEQDRTERFSVLPLKLQVGQTLTLGVHAQDGDTLNGPHVAHGELFTFRIVSQEDLLARLYDREVNLRLRFEQIRSEVSDLRTSLEQQRTIAWELESGASGENGVNSEKTAQASLLSAFVERGWHQLRKNETESRSVAVSFQDLRAEMVNNGVDSRELLDRIDSGVIAPLKELNETAFVTADQKFGIIRLSVENEAVISDAVDETVTALDDLLQRMDEILAEMRDRGTFNDLIQNLQDIIERQQKLLEETEDKRIEENFFFPLN